MKRNCPVCKSSTSKPLYRQIFSQMSEAVPIKGYDVVVCQACGFGYADNVPSQKELDAYYREMSKYENKHQAGKPSDVAMANYQTMVETIGPFLPGKDARIADIGCATGGLLAVFKRNGYTSLAGIDPSPSCAQTAAELYGFKVITSSLFDLKPFDTPFDVLVFSSVLEHLIDLEGALPRMRDLLAPNGLMVVEVPDTVNFATRICGPFQQFSVEHVNFFTPSALSNLLRRHGFAPVAIWHDIRTLGEIKDPSLTAVFRKAENVDDALVRDYEAETALQLYIQRSKNDDAAVLKRVEELAASQRPILVWGTGTQTQRLLATTPLVKACIQAFVDSNPNYQGKRLNGIPIIAPNELLNHPNPILISSRVFQEEIISQIRNVLHLENEIIKLFESASLAEGCVLPHPKKTPKG